MKTCIGLDLITTDGTTLLGADNKAGVAEIMAAVDWMVHHPEFKHGAIKVGFTPDEEIGRSIDYFDVGKFGADLDTRSMVRKLASSSTRISMRLQPILRSMASRSTLAVPKIS